MVERPVQQIVERVRHEIEQGLVVNAGAVIVLLGLVVEREIGEPGYVDSAAGNHALLEQWRVMAGAHKVAV